MFGWFRKRQASPTVFDSNDAAFEHAWAFMNYRMLLEAVIPAMVLETGHRGAEGERYFRLRLALKDGINELWACTLKESEEFPEPGDLVGFRVVTFAPELPPEMSVIGYISCKLDPVLVGEAWKISRNYTPPNIKKAIRF